MDDVDNYHLICGEFLVSYQNNASHIQEQIDACLKFTQGLIASLFNDCLLVQLRPIIKSCPDIWNKLSKRIIDFELTESDFRNDALNPTEFDVVSIENDTIYQYQRDIKKNLQLIKDNSTSLSLLFYSYIRKHPDSKFIMLARFMEHNVTKPSKDSYVNLINEMSRHGKNDIKDILMSITDTRQKLSHAKKLGDFYLPYEISNLINDTDGFKKFIAQQGVKLQGQEDVVL